MTDPDMRLVQSTWYERTQRPYFERPDAMTEEQTLVQRLIREECDALCAMLLEKNRKYGNSALEPVRIFSRANPMEQLAVRLDDKLSRIRSGQPDEDEDVDGDIAGYLVLRKVMRRLQAGERLASTAG
ncbi:hypothetical protein [Thioalbus denitrificans]|uniref:Uncharacterized protein n=1 Tax=Thioalbus denitrificans TaxID=547122 RepID=A0A369CDT5_9GAMM|nr:hypothetical protein [Thioalbus denitrificans]RCX32069.1 hypothetical protein DFQ59_102422 [Thioalbus denitrificans]